MPKTNYKQIACSTVITVAVFGMTTPLSSGWEFRTATNGVINSIHIMQQEKPSALISKHGDLNAIDTEWAYFRAAVDTEWA